MKGDAERTLCLEEGESGNEMELIVGSAVVLLVGNITCLVVRACVPERRGRESEGSASSSHRTRDGESGPVGRNRADPAWHHSDDEELTSRVRNSSRCRPVLRPTRLRI